MEPTHDNAWEHSLEQLARRFDYPPAPEIAAAVRLRTTGREPQPERRAITGRLAFVLILIALVVAGAMAIPRTRAAVLSLFARIGAIDIFIDETAPAPPPTLAATAAPATARPDRVEHSLALFELGEAIPLEEARQAADFPLVVPESLGQPDEVYVHRNVDLPAITLVWRDENGPPLSLTEIGAAGFALKMVAEEGVQWVRVGERDAVWLEGPHALQLFGSVASSPLRIESNVLIWADEIVTYRLEGELGEAEMIAIAETMLE